MEKSQLTEIRQLKYLSIGGDETDRLLIALRE